MTADSIVRYLCISTKQASCDSYILYRLLPFSQYRLVSEIVTSFFYPPLEVPLHLEENLLRVQWLKRSDEIDVSRRDGRSHLTKLSWKFDGARFLPRFQLDTWSSIETAKIIEMQTSNLYETAVFDGYLRCREIFEYFNFIVADDFVESVNDRVEGMLLHPDGHDTKIVLISRIVPATQLSD